MSRVLCCLALVSLSNVALAQPTRPPQYPDDVRVRLNVAYLGDSRVERADLYQPKMLEAGKKYPAVVMIHGGGWTGGSKHAARELNVCGNLARNGYVALSIDYALASPGKPTWPQNLHDCQTAVRWLRKNAAELQVDPEHIGVIGGSAGGHLAALVALLQESDRLDAPGPYAEFSCRVNCGVDLYGPADLVEYKDLPMLGQTRDAAPDLYRQASPVTYARKTSPPLLILHGTADKTVAVSQSERLAAALKQAGAPVSLHLIKDAPHTFDLQPKQQDLRPLVLGFFDQHLKPGKR